MHEEEISCLLDATPDLLPYLPELLRDLESLGGSQDVIAELLAFVEVRVGSTRVLDAGCGKGAVAIRLAEDFRVRVDGVDLFPPFIEEARTRAEARGVGTLCRFSVGEVRETLARDVQGEYDVVVFASMGGVFPDLIDTVRELRRAVRPSGYIIVDDGFLRSSTQCPPEGYEYYRSHRETIECLETYGDTVLTEVVVPADRVRQINEDNLRAIARRADALVKRCPEMADRFQWYVAEQRRQGEFAASVETAIWLIQKRSGR